MSFVVAVDVTSNRKPDFCNPPSNIVKQTKTCKGCGSTTKKVLQIGFCAPCLQDMLNSHENNKSETSDDDVVDTNVDDRKDQDHDHGENTWFLQGSLSQPDTDVANSEATIRKVSVHKDLETHLKSHQKTGVEFIWRNCFADCKYYDDDGIMTHNADDIG